MNLKLLLAPVLLAAAAISCHQKTASSLPDTGAIATTATNRVAGASTLFVTQNLETFDHRAGTHAVSIAQPHRAVLSLKGLTPGAEYQASFSLSDEKGQELLRPQPSVKFTPKEPYWTIYTTFRPDSEAKSAGVWTWVAGLEGVGTFTREVRVSDSAVPTGDELSLTEKARALVFDMVSLNCRDFLGVFDLPVGLKGFGSPSNPVQVC